MPLHSFEYVKAYSDTSDFRIWLQSKPNQNPVNQMEKAGLTNKIMVPGPSSWIVA